MKGKPKLLPYRLVQVHNYLQRQNNAEHAKLSIDNTNIDRCFTIFSETVHSAVVDTTSKKRHEKYLDPDLLPLELLRNSIENILVNSAQIRKCYLMLFNNVLLLE